MFTCEPTFAPKSLRRARRSPKHGLGVMRKTGLPMLQNIRASCSRAVYFSACRLEWTSNIAQKGRPFREGSEQILRPTQI
jgi:hypothetical protein